MAVFGLSKKGVTWSFLNTHRRNHPQTVYLLCYLATGHKISGLGAINNLLCGFEQFNDGIMLGTCYGWAPVHSFRGYPE